MINIGNMYSDGLVEIRLNQHCETGLGAQPCRHCVDVKPVKIGRDTVTTWVCPRVVVAECYGGINETGVCLDCVIEVAATLPAK